MTEDLRNRVETILNSALEEIDISDIMPSDSRMEIIVDALEEKIEESRDICAEYAEDAAESATAAQTVKDSIPADYSALSLNVAGLNGGVSFGDDRINELYGTFNYGYDEPAEFSAGSTASTALSVKRSMERITLNGSASANNFIVKVNNDVQRASTNSQIDSLTNGTQFESGHTYRIISKKVSGTGTRNGAEYYPTVVAYKAGQHATVGTVIKETTSEFIREFTADGSVYFIGPYCHKGATLTNMTIELTMQDMADKSVYDLIDEMTVDEGTAWN